MIRMLCQFRRCYIGLITGLLLLLSGCVGSFLLDNLPAKQLAKTIRLAGGEKEGYYTVQGQRYKVLDDSRGYLEIGVASWYGKQFHGRLTANGETFNMYNMSAAHRELPLPTFVKVTNLDNMRSAILRVNDRGPFHDDRLIDLSFEAARVLGFVDKGIAPVVVEAVDRLNYKGQAEAAPAGENIYLQLGAFSTRERAEQLLAKVKGLTRSIPTTGMNIKILESEDAERILHKVWMGPVKSQMDVEKLSLLVESANLGQPLQVQLQ